MEQSPNVEMRNMYAFLHAFSHALPYVANIGKHMGSMENMDSHQRALECYLRGIKELRAGQRKSTAWNGRRVVCVTYFQIRVLKKDKARPKNSIRSVCNLV